MKPQKEDLEPVDARDFFETMRTTRQKCIEQGHALNPFVKNRQADALGVLVARCSKCLTLALIDEVSGEVRGVAVSHPCDSDAMDKDPHEFKAIKMSSEHRSRLDKPWKAPSER